MSNALNGNEFINSSWLMPYLKVNSTMGIVSGISCFCFIFRNRPMVFHERFPIWKNDLNFPLFLATFIINENQNKKNLTKFPLTAVKFEFSVIFLFQWSIFIQFDEIFTELLAKCHFLSFYLSKCHKKEFVENGQTSFKRATFW